MKRRIDEIRGEGRGEEDMEGSNRYEVKGDMVKRSKGGDKGLWEEG